MNHCKNEKLVGKNMIMMNCKFNLSLYIKIGKKKPPRYLHHDSNTV